MMTEQLDSSALSAALSHLAQTTAVSTAPPLTRPLRARLSPDPHFWNQSLKSPNPPSDWYPLTGFRIFSPPDQNASSSLPQTPSDGYATGSVYPTSSASPESSPRKPGDVTGASGSDLMWNHFFGSDNRFTTSSLTTDNTDNSMYRNLMSSAMAQTDSLSDGSYGFWSETTYTQPATARPPAAAIWSSASPYSSLFGSGPAVSTAPPGFANGNGLNPNASAWNRSAGYGFARQPQPDYLTGGDNGSYYTRFNNNNSLFSESRNQNGLDISSLEQQFRDFKLKPKILTDQYSAGPDVSGYGRKSRTRNRRPTSVQCVFCLSNGEEEKVFKSHVLKDPEGRVVCPVLRLYSCPVCNNRGGDYAHTIKYCPRNKPAYRHLMKKQIPGQGDGSIRSRFQSPALNRNDSGTESSESDPSHTFSLLA